MLQVFGRCPRGQLVDASIGAAGLMMNEKKERRPRPLATQSRTHTATPLNFSHEN